MAKAKPQLYGSADSWERITDIVRRFYANPKSLEIVPQEGGKRWSVRVGGEVLRPYIEQRGRRFRFVAPA